MCGRVPTIQQPSKVCWSGAMGVPGCSSGADLSYVRELEDLSGR